MHIDEQRSSGRGYYRHLCFNVYADSSDGELQVADGGFVDWTAQLVGSRKERCMTSGIGLVRLGLLRAARR